jgi:hypothetical protein
MAREALRLREKVRSGVRFLNGILGKGWQKRIDVDKLDLSECRNCILGQLYGNYHDSPIRRHFYAVAVDSGFAGGWAIPGGYPALTEAWKKYFADLKRKR